MLAVEELNLVDADDFERAKRTYKGIGAEQLRALMLDIVAALAVRLHIGLDGATSTLPRSCPGVTRSVTFFAPK